MQDSSNLLAHKPKLEELAQQLSLPHFDLLLTGDASGTILDKSCGFACIAYSRGLNNNKEYVVLHKGAINHGTNNFAELIPYVHALYYDMYVNKMLDIRKGMRNRIAHVVSDSELIVRQGNKQYQREANLPFWAAIDSFTQLKYVIHWTHIRRLSNQFNKLCDRIAGEERLKMT
jgi:ribonuclease HI